MLGVQYQQDNPFTEFLCLWHDRNYPTNCGVDVVGANLHVYLRNTGASSVTVNDVTLAGYSLKTVIKNQDFKDHHPYSIYYYWDDPPQTILDAGEPVWCKGDPAPIPAGGVGQAVIRLRRIPATGTVTVGVVVTGGTVTTNVTVDANTPQLASVGFSDDLTKVYLHWRRTSGGGCCGAAPAIVKMDGVDVTANTTTVGDPSLNFGASIVELTAPLENMSYHVFQGVYADGATATASLRTWANPFIYGSWAAFPTDDYDFDAARAWIDTCEDRGINALITSMSSGGLADYLATPGGRQYAADHNYGFVIQSPGQWHCNNPLMWFLDDEPDGEESTVLANSCGTGLNLPCGSNPTGILGLHFVQEGETLRAADPTSPTTINLNGGYKPYGWQIYGQLADVLMIDSYYQKRLMGSLYYNPNRIPLYRKATVIYATALAGTTAAEPNPFHMLLYSCEARPQGYPVFPFAPPETKRSEVYYALAGGAKGMGFWWFKPGGESNGLGDQSTAAARALWKEIGLLGNEIKTAQPLLVPSHPVDLPVAGSSNVWVRPLAVDTDTMMLIVVNDDHYNDASGCHYTPVVNATVTATLPTWMRGGQGGPASPAAFEITAGGLRAVSTQINGSQLQMNLGTLQMTKMIVLTRNSQLPTMINQRYNQEVRPGICAFASELCGNSAPAIVVQPQNQIVLPGENPMFTVVANGTPSPSYQWRFNGVNLTGVTGYSYTRTNAQADDTGGYSVVVSNSLGSVTSVVATLTVSTNGIPPSIISPPQSQAVDKGQNATFNVMANGTAPLSYQWRFNGGNLAGATGTAYTRYNTQTNDAGSYAVVVTNAAGAITSAPATLTVTVPIYCLPVSLANGDFEGGNTGGVASGWTAYEVNGPTTKVWTIQTALPPVVGSQYQQIQAYNAGHTASAGVRQNITRCVVGATYQISGWYRSNSDYGRARVRVSPSASTDWSTAIDLDPVADYGSGETWATFNGTAVATGTNMTLWLGGRTITGTSAKVGCFDAVTVTCVGPTAPPVLEYKRQEMNVVFCWPTNYGNYSLISATNIGGSTPWSAVLPLPTVVDGTNVVTNAISDERNFYRLKKS